MQFQDKNILFKYKCLIYSIFELYTVFYIYLQECNEFSLKGKSLGLVALSMNETLSLNFAITYILACKTLHLPPKNVLAHILTISVVANQETRLPLRSVE